jgi:hypothetical protein
MSQRRASRIGTVNLRWLMDFGIVAGRVAIYSVIAVRNE